jgi:TPR repeat protein
MYRNGQGVPQDDAQAVAWWRQAAEQGDADAQYSLGLAYSLGRGVPQDYVEAHKWFNLAASRVSAEIQKTFAESRDAVAEKMTPTQIAEAQTLARAWHAAFDARQQ